jgi:hypothetical protein
MNYTVYNNYYLVKYFHLNENFILLIKESSDQIGFGLENFGLDEISNISQLSDYKRPMHNSTI